jgi:phosphopantetheine adenylyltransferase
MSAVNVIRKIMRLKEAAKQSKNVELFIGRFQPLHKGHAGVISKMKNPVVGIVKGAGTSTDKSKNPLDAKEQARMVSKAFPGVKVILVSNGYVPDIAKGLRSAGLEVTAVYGGDDRVDAYARQISSFNKSHPDEKMNIAVKNTFAGGKRIAGVSATLVRQSVRDNDLKTFKSAMPKELHSEWEFLRKKIV